MSAWHPDILRSADEEAGPPRAGPRGDGPWQALSALLLVALGIAAVVAWSVVGR